MKYRPHPVALIFPMMGGEAFASLAESIRTHGLQEPIVVAGDVLLDGRNRLKACEESGVKPRFVEWAGADGITQDEWIIAKNKDRRHLNPAQLSMCASDYGDYLRKQQDAEAGSSVSNLTRDTRGDAAGAFNVSRSSVVSADKVKREAHPEMQRAVRDGRVSVSAAAKATKAPKAAQATAARKGKAAVARLAKESAPAPHVRTISVPVDVALAAKALIRAFDATELRQLAKLITKD